MTSDKPCKNKKGHAFGADGLCWYCPATDEAYDLGYYLGYKKGKEEQDAEDRQRLGELLIEATTLRQKIKKFKEEAK